MKSGAGQPRARSSASRLVMRTGSPAPPAPSAFSSLDSPKTRYPSRSVSDRACAAISRLCAPLSSRLRVSKARVAAAGSYAKTLPSAPTQLSHRQAVDPEIGADVDHRHSRPQPVTKEIHFLLEPGFLFEQDIGRDELESRRNCERDAVEKLQLEHVTVSLRCHCRFAASRIPSALSRAHSRSSAIACQRAFGCRCSEPSPRLRRREPFSIDSPISSTGIGSSAKT